MIKRQEPIAIVGIGCRFPGDVNSPGAFWQALATGTDMLAKSDDGFNGPDMPPGGFLTHIDKFDYAYFGIAPREASQLDPQQRLLLEVTVEALDDAGIPRDQVQGGNTGVFVGVWGSDFEASLFSETNGPSLYGTTGSGRYAASGRISFFLDIYGPSITIDTACSSSLVAVHLASQSLRQGECKLALAGGANVILQPQVSNAYGASGMLSPQARCKFGDESADGYVRSEGAAVVALKLLSQAEADNDPIYALIDGSVVSHDGKRGLHFVSPGIPSQEALLRQALEVAQIEHTALTYVEAHGTGTSVGDFCELNALHNVLGSHTVRQTPLPVGSVKSNFGHMEAAAGVAGLIKVALMLSKRQIPASLHVKNPNARVPWEESHLFIPQEMTSWEKPAGPRLAGVTSFGITGTNAHAILSDPPEASRPSYTQTAPLLIPISAHSLPALKMLALQLAQSVANSEATIADWAYTLGLRRSHLRYRALCLVSDLKTLTEALQKISQQSTDTAEERFIIYADQQPEKLMACGQQFLDGEDIDWTSLVPMGQTLRLPNYPWQRQSVWFNDLPVRHGLRNVRPGAAKIGIKLPPLAHAPHSSVWNIRLNGKHPLQQWPNPELAAHVAATLQFDNIDISQRQIRVTQSIESKLANGFAQLWIHEPAQGQATFDFYARPANSQTWLLAGKGSCKKVARLDSGELGKMRLQLTRATESQLVKMVPAAVRKIFNDILNDKQAGQAEQGMPFNEIGLALPQSHSVCRHLQSLIDANVTPTILSTYPTLDSLSDHISSAYFLKHQQATETTQPQSKTAQQKYGDLSTDALAAKLAARLGKHTGNAKKSNN